MIIGIDARPLLQEGNGIKTYSYNLLKSLAEIDQKNDYILFLNKPDKRSLFFKQKLIQANPFLLKLFFTACNIRKEKVDIFHSLASTLPIFRFPLSRCKFVITVYDLTFEIFPKMLPLKEYLYWATTVRTAAWMADKVIAISEATKNDLLRLYKVPEAKIKVTHCGLDEIFRPISNTELLEETRRKYGLPEHFILCVGGDHPRKNIPTLLKAFSKLKTNYDVNQKLVILRTWLTKSLLQLLKKMDEENHIIFIEWVQEEDLPIVYNLADISVYLSLYEGFGFPPLESMACGTPVVASNVSSIPEVVGDAGILVNPYDIDEVAQAIYNFLNDRKLYFKLKDKGLKRAKNFTWEEVAQKTLKIWKEVLSE